MCNYVFSISKIGDDPDSPPDDVRSSDGEISDGEIIDFLPTLAPVVQNTVPAPTTTLAPVVQNTVPPTATLAPVVQNAGPPAPTTIENAAPAPVSWLNVIN